MIFDLPNANADARTCPTCGSYQCNYRTTRECDDAAATSAPADLDSLAARCRQTIAATPNAWRVRLAIEPLASIGLIKITLRGIWSNTVAESVAAACREAGYDMVLGFDVVSTHKARWHMAPKSAAK